MTEISFSNVVILAAVAFAAPLALGLIPRLRLPAVVLEIVLRIAVGPSGLGWVKFDLPVEVPALVGLAFLLFLAGLDVELGRLQGRLLRLAGLGFVVSLGLALSLGYALAAAGQVRSPLFVGIVLSATSLGLVAPILMGAGESERNTCMNIMKNLSSYLPQLSTRCYTSLEPIAFQHGSM